MNCDIREFWYLFFIIVRESISLFAVSRGKNRKVHVGFQRFIDSYRVDKNNSFFTGKSRSVP